MSFPHTPARTPSPSYASNPHRSTRFENSPRSEFNNLSTKLNQVKVPFSERPRTTSSGYIPIVCSKNSQLRSIYELILYTVGIRLAILTEFTTLSSKQLPPRYSRILRILILASKRKRYRVIMAREWFMHFFTARVGNLHKHYQWEPPS